MDKKFSDLLIELGIFSQTKPGFKYNIKLKKFEDSSSYLTSIKRFFYKESKDELLIHIENIINSCITILHENLELDKKKILTESLMSFISGIKNFLDTYKDYPDFVSKINAWILQLEMEIKNSD
jgi:hypothetical protein